MHTPLSSAQGCAILAYFAVVHEWRARVLSAALGAGLAGLPYLEGLATTERLAYMEHSLASTVSGLPDWSVTGPPDALTVACATLVVCHMLMPVRRAAVSQTTTSRNERWTRSLKEEVED